MTLTGARPVIISHRGASGYLPEESVQAYQLALTMRPDYIEGDVYLTADNVPVMLHDGTLNATTNVVSYAATHPAIAALRSVNGSYDVTRFTLAQVKELTATCRNATGYCTDKRYYDANTAYKISTYGEFLDLAYGNALTTGVDIGIYVEAKQSGIAVAQSILAGLVDTKYNGYFLQGDHAYTQSFDPSQVAFLNANSAVPVTYLGVLPTTATAAASVAAISDGVGPSASQLSQAGVDAAHAAGLYVHPYTYLNGEAAYLTAFGLGVDGVFTNFPDLANGFRGEFYPSTVPLPASAPLFGAALLALAGFRLWRKDAAVGSPGLSAASPSRKRPAASDAGLTLRFGGHLTEGPGGSAAPGRAIGRSAVTAHAADAVEAGRAAPRGSGDGATHGAPRSTVQLASAHGAAMGPEATARACQDDRGGWLVDRGRGCDRQGFRGSETEKADGSGGNEGCQSH